MACRLAVWKVLTYFSKVMTAVNVFSLLLFGENMDIYENIVVEPGGRYISYALSRQTRKISCNSGVLVSQV